MTELAKNCEEIRLPVIAFRPFPLPVFDPGWKDACTGCRHLEAYVAGRRLRRADEEHTILRCHGAPSRQGAAVVNAIEARDPGGWCGPTAARREPA